MQAVIAKFQRRLSMGDDETGFARQLRQIVQQLRLGLLIQRTGTLVQQQDGRARQNGPGNGNALLDIEALFCALLPERR